MEELKLPEHFEEYAEGRKAGFLKMKAAKEAGRRVAGYFCTYTPLEVLDAAGLLSVSLCATSSETIPAAEAVLPKNLCPLIKSSYGFAITDKCPYTYWSDLIVGETTCDGKKKMYDLLGQKKKTYILQIPQGVDFGYSRKLWIREVRRFVDYVSAEFGVAITDDMLRAAAVKRNALRQARTELMELLRLSPVPMSGTDLYTFLDSLSFSFDIDDAIASAKALTAEIRSEAADKKADSRKRILVTGCPIGGVLQKVIGSIEQNGGCVVCFENCGGIKAARCLVDTQKDDIIEAIADAYMNIGCSVMSPNTKRMKNLPELVDEFKADGVIDVSLQTCTTYMIESRAVHTLCQSLQKPYMSLSTDYSREDGGQIDTRIAAFIETLC